MTGTNTFKIAQKEKPEDAFWLVKDSTVLSNEHPADLIVKTRHSKAFTILIHRQGNSYYIEADKNAPNIIINSRTIYSKTLLKPEDDIKIGSVNFVVSNNQSSLQAINKLHNHPRDNKYWKLFSQTQGKQFLLAPYSVIGHHRDCNLWIPHKSKQDKFAEFVVTGGKVLVKKLTSDKELSINDQNLNEGILADGDQLSIGRLSFVLVAPALSNTNTKKGSKIPPSLSTPYSTLDAEEVPSSEKQWKLKPTSYGNRYRDNVDKLYLRHKKMRKMQWLIASVITLSILGLTAYRAFQQFFN